MTRLLFDQSVRWHRATNRRHAVYVYSDEHCCHCARPTAVGAQRLRTARTNDGEWWLVDGGEDLTAPEWRDFQTQLDGSRAPTLLPVGPDCFRKHPEWRFALGDPEQ